MRIIGTLAFLLVLFLGLAIYDDVHQAGLDPFGPVESMHFEDAWLQPAYKVGETYIPARWHPDDWWIVLENGKRIHVTEDTWDNINVGDYWERSE